MSRRRGHDDDDGNERTYRKRRKVSENQDIEDRLESLILQVGEKKTSSLEISNLEELASVLEASPASFRNKMLKVLAGCATNMPEKYTIYTTLVALLNAKDYNFGGEFVEYMVRNFKDALKSCKWDVARYSLRFLADLVNCHVIAAGSLLQFLDNMVDVAKEDGVPQVRRDWYIYAVLSTLPWVGRKLYEKKEQALEHLITSIEAFFMKRTKNHHDALKVWISDTPHPQEEYLDCLWAQIKKLKQDNWAEKHIPRPYLAFDSFLCEGLQHNLPTLLPPPHHDSYQYPMPWVVFRLFDYTDCPEGPILPGAHTIERFLIEEHLHQIIETHHLERKDCAAQLLDVPYKAKIHLDYMIVEVIFAELFHMPSPRYPEICYGYIFNELCKLHPSRMPMVLAQAIQLLYSRIDTMNTSCFDRFVNWFSYHLSNVLFRWSWEDWESCLQMEAEHPRPKFIREVLLQAQRLVTHEYIHKIVPESFEPLLPARADPIFKYDGPDSVQQNKKEWLKHNKTNWPQIIDAWTECHQLRTEEVREPTYTLDMCLNNWPILKESQSHSLVEIDYKLSYQEKNFLLYGDWPNIKKVLPSYMKGADGIKDPQARNSLEGIEEKGEMSLPGTTAAQQLAWSIHQQCSAEAVLNVLKDLPNPRPTDDGDASRFNPLKIDVFVQTLLQLGIQSSSNSFATISEFHYVFKVLAESEEAQVCILRSIFEQWQNRQKMMVVLVDEMLHNQIIECSAVANWIFSKEMSGEFTRLYLWEILNLTIRKMSKHVSRLGTELAEARERLRRAESHSSDSEEETEAGATAGTSSSHKNSSGTDDKERPTEKMVERMEERLEAAQADQKNLFLIIFQRFITILSEHLARCNTDNRDFNTFWYRWTIGRLQQVFLAHHEQVQKYSSTLETLLFTYDLDPHILDVFHQFVSLRA